MREPVLEDQRPAGDLQPGHRGTGTDPGPVPRQKLAAMLTTAANVRVHASWDIETSSTVVALRTLARRAHAILKEARELERALVAIIRSWRPDLLERFAVGPIVAATVLRAWSHPCRVHSEAAVAMLAGVTPIPASSGQVATWGSQRISLSRPGV